MSQGQSEQQQQGQAHEPPVLPPILRHRRFLDHVSQTVSGCVMGCFVKIARENTLSAMDTVNAFFRPENKVISFNLFHAILRQYTQNCCDDYCTIYGAVFMEQKVSLEAAMGFWKSSSDFDFLAYAFRTFNQIFEESRRAMKEAENPSNSTPGEERSVPGPLHLNCISLLICMEFAPMIFDEVFESFPRPFAMAGAGKREPQGVLSEAEKNLIRYVLNDTIKKAIEALGEKRLEEVKALKFVCKDDSCDGDWDWTSMPPDRQAETRERAVQEFKRLREEGPRLQAQQEEDDGGDDEGEEGDSESESDGGEGNGSVSGA